MLQSRITIEEYNTDWPVVFEKIKSIYQSKLGSLVLDIQHVGSTSVPGLSAKPILDMDIIMDPKTPLEPVIRKLEGLGYEYQGDLGIKDRNAFKRSSENTPLDGTGSIWMKHNVYVCPIDSISLKNHLACRDFLRKNDSMAREYGRLKKNLAQKFPFNIDLYIEGKTDFIIQILKLQGFDDQQAQAIRQENNSF